MIARLRLIAGPNGSGKTTLTNSIRQKLGDKFGIYINADEIEQQLRNTKTVNLNSYGLKATHGSFDAFYKAHPLYAKAEASWTIIDNLFVLLQELPQATYFPTLFADFVREELLAAGASFAFETVMSEPGKIDLLKRAQAAGYRTYLYFVCVDDVEVNIQRVAGRVQEKGHSVPNDKIISRYLRSLGNLLPAIKHTNRAFLYDNSGREHVEVAQITDGSNLTFDIALVPLWLEDYVLKMI